MHGHKFVNVEIGNDVVKVVSFKNEVLTKNKTVRLKIMNDHEVSQYV